jgi:hypothetical protein
MLKKASSISTMDVKQTITINDDNIVMIAQPKSIPKLMRIINHWIDNLIKHTEDPNINMTCTWYSKWKTVYKFVRSSKRDFLEVYHIITTDYTATSDTITVLDLIQYFVNNIPRFVSHYDVNNIPEHENDKNYFQFTLRLYYNHKPFQDDNNAFNTIRSIGSAIEYTPFTDNHSITTWNTNASVISQTSTIPPTMVIAHENSNNNDEDSVKSVTETNEKSPVSGDTNLSYSPKDTTQVLNPAPLVSNRFLKNNKKSEELKSLVSQTCKSEIQNEMKTIRNDMTNLKSTLKDDLEGQTQAITSLLKTTFNIDEPLSSIPDHTKSNVLPIYRHSMPSPKAKMHPTNNQPSDADTVPDTTRSDPTAYRKAATPSYQRSGTLTFEYNNDHYELRDGDFNKNTVKLIAVTTKSDLVNLYKQIQTLAVTYNIFVEQFDKLQLWSRSSDTIPPTCIFHTLDINTNTVDAYRRMKSALYTKLSHVKFDHPQYQAIIKHGSITQDGFEILYDLMTYCHPKLIDATTKIRTTNQRPDFDATDSIYSYTEKLQVWIDIETINNHHLSHDDILNIVVEQLQNDTRYDIAIAGINSELTLRDTFHRHMGSSVFPEGLKLKNLPSTIMSYYSEDDKKTLFPTPSTTSGIISTMYTPDDLSNAIINSFNGRQNNMARKSIDEMCKGCGKYGHDIFHNGCDFCAQFVLAGEFFKKHPTASTRIVEQFKEHQKSRQVNRNKNNRNNHNRNDPFKADRSSRNPNNRNDNKARYNTRSRARVKSLRDALSEVIEEGSESEHSHNTHTSDEDFEDAIDDEEQQE